MITLCKFPFSFASNSVWQLTKNSPSNVFPGDAKDPEILGSMSLSPPNYEDGHFHFLEETVFLQIQMIFITFNEVVNCLILSINYKSH